MWTYIDLFAGCGGLGDGFEASGFYEGLAHVEWESRPAESLEKRLAARWGYVDAPKRVLRADVRMLASGKPHDAHQAITLEHWHSQVVRGRKIDVIIGGPPCQAYSVAGRVRDKFGMREDYRNYLFEAYVSILQQLQPSAFVFENVPGILSAQPGGVAILDRIIEAFTKAGYALSPALKEQAVFDASNYGVPQKRKRVIIVGFRTKDFKRSQDPVLHFYSELTRRQQRRAITVADAIGDLPRLIPLKRPRGKSSHNRETESADELHEPRYHNSRDIKIFRMLAEDIRSGRNEYISIEKLKKLYTKETGRVAAIHKYHVLRWGEPSNLIPAHLHKDGLRHIHPDPDQARTITVREAARLQSFDDEYPFCGSQGDRYKMIGNAVPPLFGRAIADALQKVMATRKK